MKSIRNIALTALLTVGAFSAITYTSCNPDKCKDVVCQNGGTCSEGVCTCASYYTGTLCADQIRTKYYNSYKGNGTDSDGDTYTGWTMKFYKVGDDAKVLGMDILDNTNASVESFTVTLQSNTTFKVDSKTTAGTTYSGTGSVNETTASLTLVAVDGSGTLTFTFTNMNKL